ncbi:MAG: hypothetical protein IT319_04615 [Anaerolineae bacterium]|nr:hypothetical protein [Anaerolineae bacterium]
MIEPTTQVLYRGDDSPLPPQTPLRAGPLTMIFESGTLRQIVLGDRVLIQQIYCAVRDQNWGTITPAFSDIKITHTDNSFQITFLASHVENEIDFRWLGAVSGTRDGTIVFQMDGAAESSFRSSRIGFCVLHPAGCAGLPCSVEHVNGQHTEGNFPADISPHQPFFDIRAIKFEPLPGVGAEVRMEGDTFEMEDQRNWSDASFKTYCPPLRVPYPVQMQQGDRIAQKITVRLIGKAPDMHMSSEPLSVSIGGEESPLPAIGLGCASDGHTLTDREIERLQALGLAHLRLDLNLSQGDALPRLRQAATEAQRMGAGLEIALTLTDNAPAELEARAGALDPAAAPVLRWLVFHTSERSTSARWVTFAREKLASLTPGAAFGGGTDGYFAELNRGRPATDAMDFVTFSTNPQVHASDDMTMIQALPTYAEMITTARRFAGTLPIVVSPVTLRMRRLPNTANASTLPRQVDTRQMSLFGAGWTLGNLKYLAEGGAQSITYYETCGWLGVMETETGSPLPEQFHSYASGVFPMYHVFADVGAFAGGRVLHSRSSDPMRVIALALRRDTTRRILLANLTASPQTVVLKGEGLSGVFIGRRLDETTVEMAMRQPEVFGAHHTNILHAADLGLTVSLLPYSLLRLDARQRG